MMKPVENCVPLDKNVNVYILKIVINRLQVRLHYLLGYTSHFLKQAKNIYYSHNQLCNFELKIVKTK